MYGKYILSPNPDPVDILSFDSIFLECDIAQGMIFKGKRSGTNLNFRMDVDCGYKYIEEFRGGVQWYRMESRDIISSFSFIMNIESNQIVTLNGQTITFRLLIKEI